MFERNVISFDRGLVARKGQAAPTPDYIPRLKTEEPAGLAEERTKPLPIARPLDDAEGMLGGLIRRRVPVAQPTAMTRSKVTEADRAARDEEIERERAELERLSKTVAEHIDNGMLHESLRLGLPLPKLEAAHLSRRDSEESEKPRTFEEAARQTLPRPTESESDDSAESRAHFGGTSLDEILERRLKARKQPRRRKLTVRLSKEKYGALKAYADSSDRTYQDILSTATSDYVGRMTGTGGAEVDDIPALDAPPAVEPRDTRASEDAKSPYDWFRKTGSN